jgi:hypothetical protein
VPSRLALFTQMVQGHNAVLGRHKEDSRQPGSLRNVEDGVGPLIRRPRFSCVAMPHLVARVQRMCTATYKLTYTNNQALPDQPSSQVLHAI